MSGEERREMIRYLITEVQRLTPEERKQETRWRRSITYRFPIEQSSLKEFAGKGGPATSVVLMSRAELCAKSPVIKGFPTFESEILKCKNRENVA